MSIRLTVAAAALFAAFVVPGGAFARSQADAFPVTITASNGKVTVRKVPQRIVSLSATATETLFAIGAGAQVVAVDDQSDYPKTAPRTTLSGYTPNVEAIAGYRPDLVVISYDPKGLVDALATLGIPVVHHDAAAAFAGAYQQMRQLGALTGHKAEADGLVTRMQQRIAKVVRKAKARGVTASVYHELDPSFYSVTSNTFVGRIYTLFGLRNIADAAAGSGSDYPQLSAEHIVSANPDIIVLADSVCCGQTVGAVAARPGWSGIAAVKQRAIVRIDDSVASRWGPRLVQLVRAVAAGLARISA